MQSGGPQTLHKRTDDVLSLLFCLPRSCRLRCEIVQARTSEVASVWSLCRLVWMVLRKLPGCWEKGRTKITDDDRRVGVYVGNMYKKDQTGTTKTCQDQNFNAEVSHDALMPAEDTCLFPVSTDRKHCIDCYISSIRTQLILRLQLP